MIRLQNLLKIDPESEDFLLAGKKACRTVIVQVLRELGLGLKTSMPSILKAEVSVSRLAGALLRSGKLYAAINYLPSQEAFRIGRPCTCSEVCEWKVIEGRAGAWRVARVFEKMSKAVDAERTGVRADPTKRRRARK